MLIKPQLNREMQGKSKIIVPPALVVPTKSKSRNITNEVVFKPVKGDLMVYGNNLEPKGYGDPQITMIVSENLAQHQKGLVRIVIKEKGVKKYYIVHIDGIMSCIYAAYAPEMRDFQKMIQEKRQRESEVVI